jgi:ABC-2 type transport system permease protein
VSSGTQRGSALLDAFIGIGIGLHFVVAVPVTTLVLSAAVLGQERRDQTLSFLVLRPIRRSTIAGSKMAAGIVASLSLNGVGATVMGVVYGLRADDWSYLAPMVVGSAIATVIYAAIFIPLGYLTERSTIIGLAYVFIWENGIAGALDALAATSAWRLGYAAFVGLAPDEMLRLIDDFVLGDLSAGAGIAVVRMVGFLAASAGFLTWILRRRDLV